MSDTSNTIDTIITALGDLPPIYGAAPTVKESRDGDTVVVGWGRLGYLRVIPTEHIVGGAPVPAAEVQGRISRRSGYAHEQIRDALRAAGMEAR